MATIFRSLFGHKKSHSKDQQHQHQQHEEDEEDRTLERGDPSSRRSYRSSSSRPPRVGPPPRFHDDSMLPPTAAYHTHNAPHHSKNQQQQRVRRGPKSCPVEYGDNEPASSRSFVVDPFRHERDHPPHQQSSSSRRRNNQMTTSASSSSHRHHPQLYQKWETSEYGSENTSPIGYQRHQQKTHQRRRQDEEEEEEEEDDDEEETTAYEKERSRYLEVKRKIRAHYDERLFNYERAQRADHRQIKELEKEKDDLVKMLLASNSKLEKERKKTDYFRRKWQETEQQLKMAPSAQQANFGPFGFQTTSTSAVVPAHNQFPPMYQFPTTTGAGGVTVGGGHQRYSFIGAPMHPISSSNTPTTSAMDTTHGGAGESLVQASDVSFLAPLAVSTTLPTLASLQQLDNLPVATASASAAPAAASNTSGGASSQLQLQPQTSSSNVFYHDDDDEDQDETKNFRDEDIEIPRGGGGGNGLLDDDFTVSDECFALKTRLKEFQGKDSGFSTTPDDVTRKAEKTTSA